MFTDENPDTTVALSVSTSMAILLPRTMEIHTLVYLWVLLISLLNFILGTGSSTRIGQQFSGTTYMNGYIDELVLYNAVLKDSEVKALFNAYGYHASALGTVGFSSYFSHIFMQPRSQRAPKSIRTHGPLVCTS
jgi:hypothetical protein